jgi:hypothetical protein
MLFNTPVFHSTDGSQMLENFFSKIADVPQNFTQPLLSKRWWQS